MSLTHSSSWVVAVICSVLNFLHLGIARLSGSMYLAVLERYDVDRSKASLPFILCYSVRNISGPFVGYISTKFGIYTVTMLGGIIAFIGIGGCYFAEDIIVIILFWGVIFGIGLGMGSVLLPEILNQHFDKYVSNANGIAFGGECIAGFVLPIFLKFSLNTYGTSGTFLILSGLMLNSIPATLLLKHFSPCQSSKCNQSAHCQEQLIGGNGLYSSMHGINSDYFETENVDMPFKTMKLFEKRESNIQSLETTDEFAFIESSCIMSGNKIKKSTLNVKNSKINRTLCSENSKEHLLPYSKIRTRKINRLVNINNETVCHQINMQTDFLNDQDPKSSESKKFLTHSYPEQKRKNSHAIYFDKNIPNHSKAENHYDPLKYYGSLDHEILKQGLLSAEMSNMSDLSIASHEKPSDNFYKQGVTKMLLNVPPSSSLASSSLAKYLNSSSNPFKIFLDPAFCMILLTQSIVLYNVTMFWTIIVDFCRDTGLSSKEEIYILIFLSVLDMVGRLGLGWITDAGFLSNSTFSSLCCLGMGISVGALVFFRKVTTIGSSVSLFGLSLGGFLIVCPGVVNDHIHQDKRGMALASRLFLFAPLSLTQSPLIGYFRGKLGSYNSIFIIVAVLCLFSSLTSLLTPYAEKFRERRSHNNSGILGRNFNALTTTAGSVKHLANESFAETLPLA